MRSVDLYHRPGKHGTKEVAHEAVFLPGACSLSPHIVLREAKIAADLEQVDLKTKKTKSGADYAAINPKGQVPALVLDDGKMLTEGPAIVQYLATRRRSRGSRRVPERSSAIDCKSG